MGRTVWSILLSLVCLNMFAQSGKVDSVAALLGAHTREDTLRVNLLNEISYQNVNVNYYEMKEYATQALHLAVRLSFDRGIAAAYNRLARALWSLGESDEAIADALKAVDIIKTKKLGNEMISESYQTLGFAYFDVDDVAKAEFYFHLSERAFKTAPKNRGLYRTYLGLARAKISLKQLDSASYFQAICIQAMKESSDPFNKALLNYLKSYDISDPKLAIESFLNTMTVAEAVGNKHVETMSVMMLGLNSTRQRNYAEAEKFLHRGLQLSRSVGIKNLTLQSYQLLIELKKQEGNFKEALNYQKAYYELRDSVFNSRKTRQVMDLESRLEKEISDQQIKLLEQEKRADAILKYALAVVLAFVVLSAFLIYRLQLSKARRTQEFLALQKSINEKLKETDLLKSRFFANISHEFRTPLSLIITPLEQRLRAGNISDDDAKLYRSVLRNSNQLLSLVNEMLDLSKLEAKKMELRVHEGNLTQFLNLLLASFDSLAESKKIHFEKEVQLSNHLIWYDSEKIEKIVNNLLFNAFKFTPAEGTVQLRVTTQNDFLEIAVKDNGIGISEEDQPRIFTSFYQAQHSIDDRPAGSGLGLALVKELVTLYRGSIKLESALGRGTAIYVSLPTTKEKLAHAQVWEGSIANIDSGIASINSRDDDTDDDLRNSEADQLLIVEDNFDLRNFIASTMSSQFSILTAKDGEEGLQMAIEHVPHLIISDVMMPKMDGISLVEKIKCDERTSHIPIILLTAKADMDSRLQGLKTGADDYLVKPFSTEELSVRANNLIEQRKKLITKFRSKLTFPVELGTTEASLDEKFIARVRKVIDSNLSDASFSVEKFAEEMNMSRANIFRKLKTMVGQSPSELVNEIRLQRAAEMIRGKVDTLAQISYAVGFNDQSYFSKRFKKRFGVTPSEYSRDVAT